MNSELAAGFEPTASSLHPAGGQARMLIFELPDVPWLICCAFWMNDCDELSALATNAPNDFDLITFETPVTPPITKLLFLFGFTHAYPSLNRHIPMCLIGEPIEKREKKVVVGRQCHSALHSGQRKSTTLIYFNAEHARAPCPA